MELVDRVNGLGKFHLNARERELMKSLITCTTPPESPSVIWPDKAALEVYFPSLKKLFPDFTVKQFNGQKLYERPDLTGYQQLTIPLDRRNIPGTGRESLKILWPAVGDKEEYFMTWELAGPEIPERASFSSYDHGCVDDLVLRLGKQDEIQGAAFLPWENKFLYVPYGIPEVHKFAAVKKLYRQADKLWRESKELIGLTHSDIEKLQYDASEHANVALRELSRQRYERALDELIISSR